MQHTDGGAAAVIMFSTVPNMSAGARVCTPAGETL